MGGGLPTGVELEGVVRTEGPGRKAREGRTEQHREKHQKHRVKEGMRTGGGPCPRGASARMNAPASARGADR